MVVLYHCASMMAMPEYFGHSPSSLFEYGRFGVPIFFGISGFIITMTALDDRLRPKMSVRQFAQRRFARILPFMWLCIAGYALIRFVGTHKFEAGPYIRAAILWPIGELRPNVIWTLRHEFLFYCLFSIVLISRRIGWAALTVWFMLPVAFAVTQFVLPELGSSMSPATRELLGFVGSTVNLSFCAGVLVGVIYRLRPSSISDNAHGFLGVIAASTVSIAAVAALDKVTPQIFYVALASTIFLLLVLYSASIRADESRSSWMGSILGDASYAIYLVHNPVLLILLTICTKLKFNNVYIVYGPMVLTAVLVGIVVHIYVERPIVIWASHIFRQPRPVVV